MTNNIIEVSGAAIYSGLYELFIQFLLPVVRAGMPMIFAVDLCWGESEAFKSQS